MLLYYWSVELLKEMFSAAGGGVYWHRVPLEKGVCICLGQHCVVNIIINKKTICVSRIINNNNNHHCIVESANSQYYNIQLILSHSDLVAL